MKKSAIKRIDLSRMTTADLDALYEECEKITPFTPSRPLTRAEEREFDRLARKGRPKVGAGARRINVTVERTLLQKTDRYARKRGMTRAAVIAEGLRRVLAA